KPGDCRSVKAFCWRSIFPLRQAIVEPGALIPSHSLRFYEWPLRRLSRSRTSSMASSWPHENLLEPLFDPQSEGHTNRQGHSHSVQTHLRSAEMPQEFFGYHHSRT